MPTVHTYYVPSALEAAYIGGGAIAGAEQDRFDRELEERQRQFDVGLDYNAQVQGLEDRLRRSTLGQQAYQFDQEQALRADSLAVAAQDNYLQRQLQAEAIANQRFQQARLQYGQFQQDALLQRRQQFQNAQAAQRAIMDARNKGVIDDQQLQQGIDKWEQTYGMPWEFPQQMAQQDAQQQEQQEAQTMVSSYVDPFDGKPLASVDEVLTWKRNGMPIDKITKTLEDRRKEARAVAAERWKRTEGFEEQKRRWDEHDENIDMGREQHAIEMQKREEQRAAELKARSDKAAADAAARDAEFAQKQALQKAEARNRAILKIADQQQAWQIKKAQANAAKVDVATLGPEPDWEGMRKQILEAIDSVGVQTPAATPTSQTTSQPYEIKTAPDGTPYKRYADGTVEAL